MISSRSRPVLDTALSLDFVLLTHGFNVSDLHALGAKVIPHLRIVQENQIDDAHGQVESIAADDIDDLHNRDDEATYTALICFRILPITAPLP